MIKNLTRVGNSFAILIDRPILNLLHIEQDTPLELSVTSDGKGLNIRPVVTEDRRTRVVRSGKRMMDIHDKTFRKLAE